MWNFYKFKNNIALRDDDNKVSYKDLIKYSNKIEKNLKKKSLTLILADNTLSGILCYIALFKKKFPILILDCKTPKIFLRKIIRSYRPENICINYNDNFFETYKNYKLNFRFKDFKFFKNINKDTFKINNDLRILASTSGSTGTVKLVRQNYSNIKSNTFSIIKYLKLNKKNTTITNLPLYYTFGMSIINTHLEVGSEIIVTKKTIFDKEFWKVFKELKINTLYGVPYTYEILTKLKFFSDNTSHLKILAQAGGKISENLQKKIFLYTKKYKKKFFIMYGQAEATTRISYLPHDKLGKKIGSIGIPIPHGKIKLVDDSNKIIKKINKIGELVYEGKNVCMGYSFSRNDLNNSDQWNGKIHTGDLAKRDRDNYYYIVGRKKRFIKIYGLSINLDEIENILKTKFFISDFAVTSNEECITIFLTKIIVKAKVLNFIKKNINVNFNLFKIIYVKSIPKLPNGKNDYVRLS